MRTVIDRSRFHGVTPACATPFREDESIDFLAPESHIGDYLSAAWALGSFPVVIKKAMALAGQAVGPPRRSIVVRSDQQRVTLRAIVDRLQHVECGR
jgi:dihydrodipicolinate synthase/N-acetylneuraminate lyase